MKKINFVPPDPVPLISFSWSEGRIFDLWMLVHTFSGMVIACGMWLAPLSSVFHYPVALLALVLWEIGEFCAGVDEELENIALDIIFGMAGFAFVYEVIVPGYTTSSIWAIGIALLALITLLNFFGWKAYKKRG